MVLISFTRVRRIKRDHSFIQPLKIIVIITNNDNDNDNDDVDDDDDDDDDDRI